jgi:hypothetical protein
MSEPLDELYLKWLYEQVADPEFEDRELTYWKVLNILFKKEFVSDIPNDENRIHDGLALRSEFLTNQDFGNEDLAWVELGCSVLELMVGLARRIEFDTDKGGAHYWFWVLMENIGLSGYNDHKRFTRRQLDRIDDILNSLIYRSYEYDGRGGFFPLREPRRDQTKVELWYQMSAYILEQNLAGGREDDGFLSGLHERKP